MLACVALLHGIALHALWQASAPQGKQVLVAADSTPQRPSIQVMLAPSVPSRLVQHSHLDAPTAAAQPAPSVVQDTAAASPALPEFSDAPPAPARDVPVQPELTSTSAQYANSPAPVYPVASRRLREQGRVMLAVLISIDGLVKDASVNVSSGYSRLDEAALAAVRSWRFVPAMRGDVAIEMRHLVPIEFVLD